MHVLVKLPSQGMVPFPIEITVMHWGQGHWIPQAAYSPALGIIQEYFYKNWSAAFEKCRESAVCALKWLFTTWLILSRWVLGTLWRVASDHNLIMFVFTVCLGCGEVRLPVSLSAFCILHCIHETTKHTSDSYLWLGNFSPGHLQCYSTSHFYFLCAVAWGILVRCLHTLEMYLEISIPRLGQIQSSLSNLLGLGAWLDSQSWWFLYHAYHINF